VPRRAVLDDLYAAWTENDTDAFAAPYAESATAILPKAYLPNREALHATMANLFAGELAGSKGAHEVQSIRLVGSDMAIVISKGATQPSPASCDSGIETGPVA
jgi:uncharacterized protein (TIGR02246 family)